MLIQNPNCSASYVLLLCNSKHQKPVVSYKDSFDLEQSILFPF